MGNPSSYLVVSAALFVIGLLGVLMRRSAIVVLVGVELMLAAANLNFIAFWSYGPHPEALIGVTFVLFAIGIAAAEAAVGLGIILFANRVFRTIDLPEIRSLKW
jgi:NADH-quinone oxidoreductase subunit K